MPNICLGNIMVKGYKNNVDEFTKIIQADYDYNKMEFSHIPHFFRVFEAIPCSEVLNGVNKTVNYLIECAWSIDACMMNNNSSYYSTCKKDFNEFYGTYLQEVAKNLNLLIEVYSEEPGMGFNEHYLFNNQGIQLIDDCVSMMEYDLNDYESSEDFYNKTGVDIGNYDFNDMKESDGYWYGNAIEFNFSIDKYKYEPRRIICKKVEDTNAK